ncbi:CBS domain-containing protein [Methermicoccus shengliensis]|uniref:CBS domain-containing protein n=1 Tax=Methermicoccus shengliensis TaxID=660064 RepID=A0A832RT11_9EURY|nr:CBS domain-containing protein [Methermicoccus shengliensis]KUK04361.1 MAG: Uncharacterized protein XD46_0945 [Euryarchaeota archaeon 55_53]KUK29480.1 MAG: Uncharacterized protein XD62_1443 [Methanosarcinales archeaon 56_1174]MDI3488664.1 hypothetical protein [Methanosarcinales archaeon]MDN5294771.1 hypothetical protein [Methanosarcinales archaeon]HIH69853.1 CBS domain-containing protein [Methermicoccus shengliensis]
MEEEATVEKVMSTPVYVVGPNEPLSRARNLMLKHKVNRLVVVNEQEEPMGMITQTDILDHLLQPDAPWRRRPVDAIPVRNAMSEGLIKIHGGATIEEAAEVLLENQIEGLPVVNEKLEGIITLMDIVRYIGELDPDILVSDVMDDFVVSVHTNQSMPQVIEKMQENEVDVVVVAKDSEHPVGVITSTNLALLELTELLDDITRGREVKMVRKNSHGGRRRYRYVKELPLMAKDVMNNTMAVVLHFERVSKACGVMVEHNLRALPVINESNELCGVVSRADIASILVREDV